MKHISNQLTLTLNRNGIFTTSRSASNQCKEINHARYKYYLAIQCANKLDDEDFIIDQLELHDIIIYHIEQLEKIKSKSFSCEKYCIIIYDAVLKELERREIKIYSIYVKVVPLQKKGTPIRAFIELYKEFEI